MIGRRALLYLFIQYVSSTGPEPCFEELCLWNQNQRISLVNHILFLLTTLYVGDISH